LSTGGAGTHFEQHVGAYWLAQLLVGAIPPILIDTTVVEVAFQTERLGWHTDDFLLTCMSGDLPRKIAGQVKRNFTVSAANAECVQAITDLWGDFNGAHFSKTHDRLALVTLRGSNQLLEHFVGLLDCARAAREGSDFEQRLTTPGFISGAALRYCGEIRTIIGKIQGIPVTTADIWPLLRALHVLSLDLQSSTCQTEAHIKSLLASTAVEGDPVASAGTSWNELVQEASAAMAASRSLRRTDLPAGARARHGVVGTTERRVLQALADHTAPVLRAIRTTLGGNLHLPRTALVHMVLEALQSAQVVLVTGPAGCGKSAVGKDAVGVLSQDHFLFGFRVEEFAQAHLDATLAAAQVPANWARLRAILGAQDRKVVLVESVERLLEKTTRDAFTDLMTLVADDPGLRVVLTCRDYSKEQVLASFLQPHHINHRVIRVPSLDDAELTAVEAAHPAIAIPLASPALRNILRIPYVLDKALGVAWASETSLPQTERDFRALFWREIVRAGHRVAPAMASLREKVLEAIAVRRARALSAHVPASDLDAAVVESLRGDSLVTSSDEDPLLVATAHDVLEDWSILQWLEKQRLAETSFKALSDAVGAHPAVRRSYRKWVAELVDRDASAADRLFQAAMSESQISLQFRDDTLVSLLKAPSAPGFLARHEAQLLANDRVLLKRVIHLLRVACVKTPDWLAGKVGQASILNVPDGSAWPAVVRLVHRNVTTFTNNERPLLLGLVEDAVRGVSWWAPELDGAEDVVGIAHWLLEGLGGYRSDESRERVLKVIAKLPKADAARFESVLRGHIEEGERRDVVAEAFQDLVIGGTDGMPAARDLPDVVISVAEDYLLASEADIRDERHYSYRSIEIDLYFGIKEGLRHDSFPPSAVRGPWVHLLRHHATKALDFYIKVFNHSADWYVHPRLRGRLEPAGEAELTFADGTTRKQWTNGRLWGLYRGMTVGPYPLESMLMALESWLLEVGKGAPEKLDGLLVDILRRSDNAALAAVVASVATAYPRAAGEALLVLLSSRDYIRVDRSRMANEHTAGIAGMFPTVRADHRVYELERKQAAALEHRRMDLEAAVANLQLGPLAPRVHALLDNHLAALPPKEQQGEDDRLWRLAIHRMDLRQYTVSGPQSTETIVTEGKTQQYVRLNLKPPEPDVQAMVDENTSRMTGVNARLGVFMWGARVFERDTDRYDPTQWATKLGEAQAMDPAQGLEDGSRSAPGLVAAVCVRDHWDEMAPPQQEWCIATVCAEVLRHADTEDHMERVQKNSTAADRACASVLPLLLRKPLGAKHSERVQTAFAAAITHPVEQVRQYATWSIDAGVWSSDRSLALRCVNAIAAEAAMVDREREADAARPYEERRDVDEIRRAARADIRARFWPEEALAEDVHVALDISGAFGADALNHLLVILGRAPQDQVAIAAYARASAQLASWWTSDDDSRERGRRNYHTESDVCQRITEFLLRTSPEAARYVLGPLVATIDRHSRELQHVMQGLTNVQDSNPNTPQYWLLWNVIADAVRRASWVSRLDGDRHRDGPELLAAVFLTLYWKDDVRHWRHLEGYADNVHALFESLPPVGVALDNYARFLYRIGQRSLPDAFMRIEAALRRGVPARMLGNSDTVFVLEVLLQRFVYGRPLEVKRDARMRNAILFILDCLIDTGSSAAFRMRDDFVTPVA
jgi:hypothetical protein